MKCLTVRFKALLLLLRCERQNSVWWACLRGVVRSVVLLDSPQCACVGGGARCRLSLLTFEYTVLRHFGFVNTSLPLLVPWVDSLRIGI